MLGLQPDIIVTGGTSASVAVQRETPTIPIVFANVTDPVAQRIVPQLARPSGNITGFVNLEASPLPVHASACELGLDRWPQRADGASMARR